jgi:hypothetical protein
MGAMTSTIKIYGLSDDLIEVVDKIGEREYYADIGQFEKVLNIGGQMRVLAMYGRHSATWCFAVSQVDDEVPLPDWPVRIVQCPDVAYSTQIEIDAPDNTLVFVEKNEDRE